MTTIAVSVGFDIFHEGHKEHIEEAAKLGDKLIVLVDTTSGLVGKKGYEAISQASRLEIAGIVKWLNPDNEVVLSVDTDGTQAETLRMVKPQIFAKGGDRTADNMPKNEIDACAEIDCAIVYGVGRVRNSSSRIGRHIADSLGKRG